MELKYLIDKYGNFVIFTHSSRHTDMAKSMYSEPIAGGFCNIKVGYTEDETVPNHERVCVNFHCYGESITTGLKSREEDEQIINKKLNNY